jgi:hypothetical protein
MAKITVCFPITVPQGDYCWRHSDNCICQYFDNFLASPKCDLRLGNLVDMPDGVKKAEKCLSLKLAPSDE